MNATRLLGCVACSVMALAGPAPSSSAQTILVDFGGNQSFRGVTAPSPDVHGNHWNSMTPGLFVVNLFDTTGAQTTIDLGFSTPVGTDSFNGPAGVTSFPNPTPAEIAATDIDEVALGILGVKEAAIDFAASPGGADNRTRFEIQQLDPTLTYNLSFFGSHKFSTDDATVYSIFSDNTYTTLVGTATLNVQQPGSPNLHNRDQLATINNVAPQADNILYVEFVGANGGLGYLNAFSITAVPEPASMILLASATGLLMMRRRR